jgi:2-amino-4-hydroxy-6-hydroxymethyldihydropteridine diphosphokinase
MICAFVAAGSNLGDRLKNFKQAQSLLEKTPGVTFLRSSPIYETEPVGGPPQGKYLNAVWEIETDLTAWNLLQMLLAIEKQLGREKLERNFPRTLDLDLLFYGHEIVEQQGLFIPHPRLHERSFVLKPLADLAPEWIHPKLKKTVQSLLEDVLERNPKS